MALNTQTLQNISLAERLGRLSRLWRMAADNELGPLGLTHPRWTALWKLSNLGDHVSQKKLAQGLEIELASLMRTLTQLEEQGLVVRYASNEDKRVRIVSLTSEGKKILAVMEDKILTVRRRIYAGLSEADLKQFEVWLSLMTDNSYQLLHPESE